MRKPFPTTDPFVPFDPVPPPGPRVAGTPLGLKVVAQAQAGPAFAPLPSPGTPHAHAAAGARAKPIVILQRDGDRVTAIRIECACGQVIELACSY